MSEQIIKIRMLQAVPKLSLVKIKITPEIPNLEEKIDETFLKIMCHHDD